MTIFHHLNDFFYSLFPQFKSLSLDQLPAALEQLMAEKGFSVKASVEDDMLHLQLLDIQPGKESTYQKAIALCEKEDFEQALPLLEQMVQQYPMISDYHRLIGQVKSELGYVEAAIDHLIDALRLDPKNTWALLMMGNIYATSKRDLDTAMTYYHQAAI